MPKDYFGRELHVGDVVVYSVDRGSLRHAVILEIKFDATQREHNQYSFRLVRMEQNYGRWDNRTHAMIPPNPNERWKLSKVSQYTPASMIRMSTDELGDHEKEWCHELLKLKTKIMNGEKI